MAGRIRQEDIEAVRERTDLAKVIGEYLTLKKAGHDSLVGLCPFHSEKSPSFSVSPSKQVYYCFGCGAGGDAVRFLMEIEHLSFVESIERLARGAGITLRFEGDSPTARKAASRRQSLYKANETAAGLFHKMLLEGKEASEARAYLEERGIGEEQLRLFQVGYAPGYADFLMRRMAKEVSADLLVEAGLVTKDAEGALRDRFRGRITFPIRDLSGRHVGFGARVLPSGESKTGKDGAAIKVAKYLNTAETPIYRKSDLLYHLDRAKAAITRTGEVVVTEGYTDVIGLAEAGVENVVATCGTSLTVEHVRLLSRFAKKAILTFDGDEAGARAAERAFAFVEETALQLMVLILPDGLDPAEYVKERGGGPAFAEAASGATPLVEYMLRRIVGRSDTSTIEGRTQAIDEALPLVRELKDPVRRQQYVHLLSDLAGVEEDAVRSKLGRVAAPAPASSTGFRSEVPNQPATARPPGLEGSGAGGGRRRGTVQERVEWEMLKVLARNPEAFAALAPDLTDEHFESDRNRELFRALVAADGDVRAMVADPQQERLAARFSELTVEPLEGEPGEGYAKGVWLRLEELRLQRRSGEVRRRLQQLNPTSDPGYDDLFSELIAIDGELRRVRERVGVDG